MRLQGIKIQNNAKHKRIYRELVLNQSILKSN